MRTVQTIEAVVQKNPCGDTWYAGYGCNGVENGRSIYGMGCYLVSTHETIQEAKAEAIELAKAYRNTVLTLGGCTFDTLPPISFSLVGQDLSHEYDF